MEIKNFGIFLEGLARTDNSLKILKRTKELNGSDFLEILNENCKNFSFNNTQLWRSKAKKYNLELFTPAPRNADPLAFKDFFNEIEHNTDEYPVVRKNSLIGGTDKEICKFLVGGDMYLVIPFDDSEIVFSSIMDLWAMSDDRRNLTGKNMLVNGKPISKDNFVKVSYTKDFQYLDKGRNGKGCEFFTSSPCLLVHESKIDWLKKNLK
jgi:hypothetical protein